MKFAVLAAVFWVMVSGMPAVAQDSVQAIAEAAEILLDNPKDAMKVIEPEARKGTAAAQFYLGLVYRDGIGRAADARLAKDWLGKAEEQGHGGAAVALADMALKAGAAEEADAYLEKAMAAGEAQGFALKAALLEPSDPGTAAAFFGVALGLGDAESGLRLADIYLKEGSPLADPELARAAAFADGGFGVGEGSWPPRDALSRWHGGNGRPGGRLHPFARGGEPWRSGSREGFGRDDGGGGCGILAQSGAWLCLLPMGDPEP